MTTLALVKTEDAPREDIPASLAGEVSGLAERLGRALDGMGAYHYRDAQAGNLEHQAERAGKVPPSLVSWSEMSALSERDASAGMALWEAVKAAAREEMASGARAYDVLATSQDTPMEMARFLVMRRAFIEEWQPRGAIETALLDQMAQACTMQLHWTEKATTRENTSAAQDLRTQESAKEDIWRRGEWIPERVTEAEALDKAMTMIDKWNRLFVRTLRQLRDLRRYTPIVIANAGQVNVGGQQVNLSGQGQAKEAGRPRVKRRSR